jgi:hypothetical protein
VDAVPLAEAPTIDGGALALILALLLLTGAAYLTSVIGGFRWAAQAGRGSRAASVVWGLAVVFELLPLVLYPPVGLVGLAAFAGQLYVYVQVRRDNG